MNELPSEQHRDRIVDSLSNTYALGMLDEEELERRLALVQTAKTPHELDALVTDLAPSQALVRTADLRVRFGSIERTGAWSVPGQLRARVLCGNLELDLREARLGPGITTIEVDVTMGNIEVIVPPAYEVDVDASSLFGSIEQRTEPVSGTASAMIRIIGRVRLGSLEVATQHHGESRREARYRRRIERRWRRRQLRHDCRRACAGEPADREQRGVRDDQIPHMTGLRSNGRTES